MPVEMIGWIAPRVSSRRDEARSMRQQQSQSLRDSRGMRPNKEAIRRIGKVTDQGAIEIRPCVDASGRSYDVSIERRSVRCQYLRRIE